MPKYMKDPKLKPPRDKRVELEDEVRKGHRSKRPSTPKSDHKHTYEDVFIIEHRHFSTGDFLFYYKGGRCTQCGKIMRDKWYLNRSDVPQEVMQLPEVHISSDPTQNILKKG